MNSTVVSIIVPCFNQAQYLDEALQLVLVQTFIHWKFIVVNDGSLYKTREVVKKWYEMDLRFKFFFKRPHI